MDQIQRDIDFLDRQGFHAEKTEQIADDDAVLVQRALIAFQVEQVEKSDIAKSG